MISIYTQFSEWVPWSSRSMPDLSFAGVYVIGAIHDIENQPRLGHASRLLYVGETCGQSLKQRLGQFDRSAFRNLRAHSGGTKFLSLHGKELQSKHVFFACNPVKHEEPMKSSFIRYIERAVILQHVQMHGTLPSCNSK